MALVAIRPQFSGKVFSQVQISTECKLFTVRPGSFAIPATTDAAAEVVALDVDLEDSDTRLTIVEIVESQTEAVDLTEADRIVSGGRSVKSKDNFDTLIRPLAQALGATAGASVPLLMPTMLNTQSKLSNGESCGRALHRMYFG